MTSLEERKKAPAWLLHTRSLSVCMVYKRHASLHNNTRQSSPHVHGRIRLLRSLVTSIFLYACESWTLTAELQRGKQAMEMRCYSKILHISYKDHVTNEEVRAKIQQAIGPHEDLLTIVKRRKLQWYGYVSRSSGLVKTTLQGTVKGGRRQGGQRKRWEDNIREWTGLEFGKSQKAVENRETWRKLVTKSSVVPQRPSRLRDWWWWRWWCLLSLSIFRGHSTREPASGRVTYFILRAYTGTMYQPQPTQEKSGEFWRKKKKEKKGRWMDRKGRNKQGRNLWR